jgi:hypothetical protein
VHGVPGGAQVVGERGDAGGEPLCVVEEHDLGHLRPPVTDTHFPDEAEL